MAHISEAAPLQISRFYTGWYSYRNPLIVPIRQFGRRIIELYDAIADGLNMECSNRLTLARRPGYSAVNSLDVNIGIPLYFYSFKPTDFPGQIYNLVDTTSSVLWMLPGNAVPLTLIAKATPTLTNFAQVAAYLYMSNETFERKWDGPQGAQGVTNWGIAIASKLSGGVYGPNTNSTGNDIPINVPAPAWSGGAVTVPGNSPVQASQFLGQWGYGFNIQPTPTHSNIEVVGIQVDITGLETQGAGIMIQAGLLKNSNLVRSFLQGTLPANSGTVTLGGRSELWGSSWTINDINQFGFGTAIQAINTSSQSASFKVTDTQVTVYTSSGPDVNLAGGGSLNAQVGYQYKYAYGNSYSGHISSPSPASIYSSGTTFDPSHPEIVPNASQQVEIGLVASDDPQVNQIHVYRTTDGGGQPFFELPNSPFPNTGSATTPQMVFDNAQDWNLQIANICPDPHFNDPPPFAMLDPVWFGGRLWGHRQNLLFFASGPDITQGNGAEAWFPDYTFELPSTIVRKFPTPNGMLVATNDEIYIVRGISTASFTVNEFMRDTGMRTWTAGDSDGSNIYIYTSDRQLLMINPNGLTSVAANIADRIQAVDPSLAYVAQYRYTALENWLFVSDGSSYLYPYNLELQAWATLAAPIGGVRAIASVETSPGVWQFWRGKPVAGATIAYRNPLVFTDEGSVYPCYAIFGPIPVADFLILSQVRDIALATAPTSSRIIISVLANEVFPVAEKQYQILDSTSSEPPELSATPSLSYRADRYSWKSAPLPELVNLFFHRIDFSADANPDEIYAWCVGGSQTTGGSSLGAPGQLPQLQGR